MTALHPTRPLIPYFFGCYKTDKKKNASPNRCGNGTETWTRTKLADTPEAGFADGDGKVARFDGPSGLAAAEDGTLFVADTNNHLVKFVVL